MSANGKNGHDAWRMLSMDQKAAAIGLKARQLFSYQSRGCPVNSGPDAIRRWQQCHVRPAFGGRPKPEAEASERANVPTIELDVYVLAAIDSCLCAILLMDDDAAAVELRELMDFLTDLIHLLQRKLAELFEKRELKSWLMDEIRLFERKLAELSEGA